MKEKIKIAIFGAKGFPAFGGAARSCESIVDILKEKYDFTIYATKPYTDKQGHYNGYYQIVFKRFPGKRLNTFIYYLKSVFHALMFGNYDLVHINHTSSGFIAPFLRLKYKVVATAMGIIPKDDNKWNKFDKLFFNFSAFLFFRFSNVCVSVAKPHIVKFKKITNKKILYIPNGIDLKNFKGSHVERNECILFAASRIISLKGLHVLFEALNQLSYKGKIIVIGSLEHTPKYKNQLFELSRDLNVSFTGLIKNKKELFDYIAKAKVFVFPSFNEGMSNMLLEVVSFKTPLICSDIPENIAVLDNDEALYFKSGDPEDLASKIRFAIQNIAGMHVRAEKAYKKIVKEYDWKSIAYEYDKLYQSLIRKKVSQIQDKTS